MTSFTCSKYMIGAQIFKNGSRDHGQDH